MQGRKVAVAVGVLASLGFGVATAWHTRPTPAERAAAARSQPTAAEDDLRVDAPEGAPNVVLVFGCTVRRDQIGAYGGAEGVTPWLDGLAASGTRFDDALSVSSWTRDSAVGVLTGMHPLSLGLPDPLPKQTENALPAVATTLAERLLGQGWGTFGLTANPNLNTTYGMAQGIDVYRDSHDKGFKEARLSGTAGVTEALAMLDDRDEEASERPFYLQLMLIDAHHPRAPDPARLAAQQQPGVSAELATYRASLQELDHALDQLDRGLASRGYSAKNTVFVFVADHGEGLDLPAHHGPGHGKKMYPSTVSIPWIVRGPGVPAGAVVSGLASGVDVTPTLLGLLGLPGDPTVVGRDWSAWVKGTSTGPLPVERAYSASMFHNADVAAIWTPDRQCQQYFEADKAKDVTGCFDRRADPTFTSPIEDPALHAELVAWRTARLAEGAKIAVGKATLESDVKDQLEVLGYLEEVP